MEEVKSVIFSRKYIKKHTLRSCMLPSAAKVEPTLMKTTMTKMNSLGSTSRFS